MKKKGAALLVVIIVMMLTFLLATIMFETSIKHLRVSNDTVDSTKAYYCSESGVYDAIKYIELIAEDGSFSKDYYSNNLNNLYSLDENNLTGNNYLFGDISASYTVSIRLTKLENDIQNVTINNKTVIVSTPPRERIYEFKINSKGNYNNQNYLINDTVKIFYQNGKWTYNFTEKLCTKD